MLVRSGPFQKADRERGCIHTVVWKKSSELVQNRSKIRVVQKSKPEIGPVHKRTVPFPCEQKRQVQFRSTFRTCWVFTGTRKCISLTKLATLSQYIRETLLSCRCFMIFWNSLLNLISVSPQTLVFKFLLPMLFLISLTIKLCPFRRWSMLLIVWRFSACIFTFLAELKSYKYYFLDVWRNHNFLLQNSLNSINKLLVYKFRVSNWYPKLLNFPLLLNFSVHSELIFSRCVTCLFVSLTVFRWFFWTNHCSMSSRG